MPLSPKRPSLISQGPATRDFTDAELCTLFAYNYGSMYTYVAEQSEIVCLRENDAGWRWSVTDNKFGFYNVVLNKNSDLLSRNVESCVPGPVPNFVLESPAPCSAFFATMRMLIVLIFFLRCARVPKVFFDHIEP